MWWARPNGWRSCAARHGGVRLPRRRHHPAAVGEARSQGAAKQSRVPVVSTGQLAGHGAHRRGHLGQRNLQLHNHCLGGGESCGFDLIEAELAAGARIDQDEIFAIAGEGRVT